MNGGVETTLAANFGMNMSLPACAPSANGQRQAGLAREVQSSVLAQAVAMQGQGRVSPANVARCRGTSQHDYTGFALRVEYVLHFRDYHPTFRLCERLHTRFNAILTHLHSRLDPGSKNYTSPLHCPALPAAYILQVLRF